MKHKLSLPLWSIISPILAWLIYYGKSFELGGAYDILLAIALMGRL
jgi:Ca2+:H+ antiporter